MILTRRMFCETVSACAAIPSFTLKSTAAPVTGFWKSGWVWGRPALSMPTT
ncbi:hypothetical protein [Gluconobacter potus]|uniref:hypothetical protein n=1 Tax=Gluconobacter potus TaxID=2724927 RepID=UPI0039ED82CA